MASLATVSTQAANQRVPTEQPSPRTAMQAGGFFYCVHDSTHHLRAQHYKDYVMVCGLEGSWNTATALTN